MRVTLLITCVVDVFDPEVGESTVRVLRASGCEVTCGLDQTCCGQPAWNAGFAEEAAAVARTTLDALEAELDDGAELVVSPAGSCATMIRVFWPELFEVVGDHEAAARARRVGAATRELSELLAERSSELPPLALRTPTRVAYHHSCHLLRELGVSEQPEAMLDLVSGCERVPWEADERCCGFGGLFSSKLPETSIAMADDKLASIAASGAEMVVGTDGSCLLHLRSRAAGAGAPIVTKHLAQVIDSALPDSNG